MCGVLDDLLPVIGAVAGSFIPGLGTAAGAALGGAIGGGVSGYAQNHNLLGTLTGAATGGVGGYFGGGSLGNLLTNLGENAGQAGLTTAFDTGLASNVAPSTLGGLESSAGGAGLFGTMAGTGQAIGSAANALGGGGLGVAGGDALSGISGSPAFLGGLGGGGQGTGLGIGGQTASTAGLEGTGSTGTIGGSLAAPATNQGITAPSTMSNISQTPGGVAGPTQPTTSPMGSNVLEESQAAQTGSGAPYGFDQNAGGTGMEGSQAAMAPGGGQGALAAMYGPQSTAAGSTVGQGIAGTNVEVPGAGNVQFGALGEGTPSAPGMAGAATQGAANVGETGSLQDLYNQVSPWMKLAQMGQNAYQQFSQQGRYNDYMNQINQMYSPNSPYAQQMAQTLARQDAAAGRNSQYGNRAVQLAAALTQDRARALTSAPYANASFANPMANALNGIFAFNSPQGMQQLQGLYNMGSAGLNSLSNLFGG